MKFDAFGTSEYGEGKSLSNIFLLHLSAHWGDLIEQMKKTCHIHFKLDLSEEKVLIHVNIYGLVVLLLNFPGDI